MKITVSTAPLESFKADALVVLHESGGLLGETANPELEKHLRAFVKAVEARQSRREWFCTVEKDRGVATSHLLLDSTTFDQRAPRDEPLKVAAARAVSLCRDHSLGRIAIAVHHACAPQKAAAIVEGAILGDFSDERFKSKAPKAERRGPLDITLLVPAEQEKAVKAAAKDARHRAESTNHARELVNAPHHELTPAAMAEYAAALAKEYALECEVLDEKQLKKQGYLPTYHVGRGSEYPPRLITLRYKPKKRIIPEHLGLVGKGMTFDSGGLCLKGRGNIFKMNFDMGGSAAVLGAMEAIARLELPVKVTATIASAHNAVDGAAYYPGCILTAKNGKTIFVENTDAEGRLVLTDAFARAGEEGVDLMWDFATLTGGVIQALGPSIAGLFTDDEDLRALFMKAGHDSGEEVWPLPLVPEYAGSLTHHLADLCNMSSIKAGGAATHAANFLKNFVPEGVRWAHIDLAGPAWNDGPYRYLNKGGSGFGVRLITEAVKLLREREK